MGFVIIVVVLALFALIAWLSEWVPTPVAVGLSVLSTVMAAVLLEAANTVPPSP